MEQQLKRRDKAVLTALVVLMVAGGAFAVITYFTQRADNSFTAMARGQYSLARRFYEQEVETGSPQAMNQLANLHYLGKGFAAAQLNLGHLYRQGIGVPQDPVRAFGWYGMSDVHGSPWAEQYMRLTAVEFTLTPNQISLAKESWPTLSTCFPNSGFLLLASVCSLFTLHGINNS